VEHDKWQNLHGVRLQKQLQTALILSVTFIWSHPWVGLNSLWFMIAFPGKMFEVPFSFQKCPLKPVPPPNILFLRPCITNQGPVVQKPINANLGLNLLNLGLNFNPRLLCVVQS
jgi:hypothetical protein